MDELTVRVLEEDDWRDYREVRLASLEDSPQAFAATYAEEATRPEQYWRDCVASADRVLVESDGVALGIATVDVAQDRPESGDLFDVWVTPAARNTGVAWRLVETAAAQAVHHGCTNLYYWVSTENGRAVAFASNAGFRVTSERRTTQAPNREFGDQEIALVLPLGDDPGAVPTSAPSELAPKAGPR